MSCVLRASGPDFDVDAFLADSPLKPDAVFRKGEPAPVPRRGPQNARLSGFNHTVSQASLDDLATQVDDATEFLDEYEDELRRLGSFEGVELVYLDFGVRRGEGEVHTDILPAGLLWRAGALDISITLSHHSSSQ
jgi:hypothetical protein